MLYAFLFFFSPAVDNNTTTFNDISPLFAAQIPATEQMIQLDVGWSLLQHLHISDNITFLEPTVASTVQQFTANIWLLLKCCVKHVHMEMLSLIYALIELLASLA